MKRKLFKTSVAFMLAVITLLSCTYNNDPLKPEHSVRSNDPDPTREIPLQEGINRYNAAKFKKDHLRASGAAAAIAGIYYYRNDSANYVKWENIHNQEANAFIAEENKKRN